MAVVAKERRAALIAAAVKNKPEVLMGKQITTGLMVAWILLRLFSLIMEAVCRGQGLLAGEASTVNVAVLVSAIGLAVAIASGARNLAFLPIAGSVMMIVNTFTAQLYTVFSPMYIYPFASAVYAISFILASYGQLAIMVIVLAQKNCRLYGKAMESINKQISAELKVNIK